jgi:(2R)-sulfolactate sulfo-lyase subunit alpha
MKHNVLMHEAADDVAVAVVDLKKGEKASAVTLEGQPVKVIDILEDIPLGHKIAMRDIKKDEKVSKYGRPIGKAVLAIKTGQHVHSHNLKTMRW